MGSNKVMRPSQFKVILDNMKKFNSNLFDPKQTNKSVF